MFEKLKQFVTRATTSAKDTVNNLKEHDLVKFLFPAWGFGIPIPLKAAIIAGLNPMPHSVLINVSLILYVLIHARFHALSSKLQSAIKNGNIDETIKQCSMGADPSEKVSFRYEEPNPKSIAVSMIEYESTANNQNIINIAQYFTTEAKQDREHIDIMAINALRKAMSEAVNPGNQTLQERATQALTSYKLPKTAPPILKQYRHDEIEKAVETVLWSHMNVCQKAIRTPIVVAKNMKDLGQHLTGGIKELCRAFANKSH